MSNEKIAFGLSLCLCWIGVSYPLHAMTFDYSANAYAVAEVGWYDPGVDQDFFWPVEDANETINRPCYATVYWQEMNDFGKFGISILTQAQVEPNEITVSHRVSGSYKYQAGSDLLDYFYQEADCSLEGSLDVNDFPPGTPCSVRYEVNIPTDTWTSAYFWQFDIASDWEELVCGLDPNGAYGPYRGGVTAFAGEQVYLFLGGLGTGLSEYGGLDALGAGQVQLDVRLQVTRHFADLTKDGFVNFRDFARFAAQWSPGVETPPQEPLRLADLSEDGFVDAIDLKALIWYWLLAPLPPATDTE